MSRGILFLLEEIVKKKREKKHRTRLTLDLTDNEVQRVKALEKIYDETSQAAAVRDAVMHDLYLAEQIKTGGRIQVLKKDGSVEGIVFPEWMPLMCQQ